jgi:hypothetical protein
MFSVIHAVLVKPLPYPEPDRVVLITEGATSVRVQEIVLSVRSGAIRRWRTGSPAGRAGLRPPQRTISGQPLPIERSLRRLTHLMRPQVLEAIQHLLKAAV